MLRFVVESQWDWIAARGWAKLAEALQALTRLGRWLKVWLLCCVKREQAVAMREKANQQMCWLMKDLLLSNLEQMKENHQYQYQQ